MVAGGQQGKEGGEERGGQTKEDGDVNGNGLGTVLVHCGRWTVSRNRNRNRRTMAALMMLGGDQL